MWPVGPGWCFGYTQVDNEVRAWMTCLDTLTYLGPWRWRRHSHRFTMSWRAKPPKSREDSGEDSWKLSYGPSPLDDPPCFCACETCPEDLHEVLDKEQASDEAAWEFWSHSCGVCGARWVDGIENRIMSMIGGDANTWTFVELSAVSPPGLL